MSEATQLFLGGIAAGVALAVGSICLLAALLVRGGRDAWPLGDEQSDIGGEHGDDRA